MVCLFVASLPYTGALSMYLLTLDHVVAWVTVTVLQILVRLSFQYTFLGADLTLSVQASQWGDPKWPYLEVLWRSLF